MKFLLTICLCLSGVLFLHAGPGDVTAETTADSSKNDAVSSSYSYSGHKKKCDNSTGVGTGSNNSTNSTSSGSGTAVGTGSGNSTNSTVSGGGTAVGSDNSTNSTNSGNSTTVVIDPITNNNTDTFVVILCQHYDTLNNAASNLVVSVTDNSTSTTSGRARPVLISYDDNSTNRTGDNLLFDSKRRDLGSKSARKSRPCISFTSLKVNGISRVSVLVTNNSTDVGDGGSGQDGLDPPNNTSSSSATN